MVVAALRGSTGTGASGAARLASGSSAALELGSIRCSEIVPARPTGVAAASSNSSRMASSLSAFATAAPPAPTITPRLFTCQYAMYQASVSVSAAVMRVCREFVSIFCQVFLFTHAP